jgi:hypothetical protein
VLTAETGKEMRKLAAAIVVLLTIGVVSVRAEPQTVIDDSKNLQYLFTMAAKSGTYADNTLRLTGVPLVVYFSDRPHRIAGHMDLQAFLEMWDEGVDNFKADPPNAELAIFEESGVTHTVLIVSKPAVDGDDISFDVDVIDEKIPATFEQSTLFIDNFRVVGGR